MEDRYVRVGDALSRGLTLYGTYPRSDMGRDGEPREFLVLALGVFTPSRSDPKGKRVLSPGDEIALVFERYYGFKIYKVEDIRVLSVKIDASTAKAGLARWDSVGRRTKDFFAAHWKWGSKDTPKQPSSFVDQAVPIDTE
jgi:hypothetical protein